MAKSIIVSQIGARHRYLIPRILYKYGVLHSFFTDSCQYSLLGSIAKCLVKLGLRKHILMRLSNRNPMIPRYLVKTTDYLSFKRLISRNKKSIDKYITTYQSLSQKFKKYDIENADCVYNMYFENIDFLKYAKHKGKTIVADIYENPKAFALLIDEIKKHPELSSLNYLIADYKDKDALRRKYIENLLALADYYTVPSAFVMNSLKEYKCFNSEKAFLLPYPTSIQPKVYNYRPRKHTLIWVGNDPIRKGLIYCAKAATILKGRYPDLDFRIIGQVNNKIVENPAFKDLHFCGILGANELRQEYETAEAYIFPTLFEGFAGTVIEAATCGCPIVTTEGAGTDMNKFPAIYIDRYNYEQIVSTVITLFENPQIRDDLSMKVYEYAKYLSPEVYENELIKIISAI